MKINKKSINKNIIDNLTFTYSNINNLIQLIYIFLTYLHPILLRL